MSAAAHPLRERLAAGGVVAGIWSIIPSAQACGTLAAAGFDFVILDCEHGGYDFATLEAGITACQDGGCTALVRAPGADAYFVQRALDLGADGILVPQVTDAATADRVVKMAHFPPDGTRGYNPFTRGGHYGIPPQPKLARGYPFTGVLVESPQAARSLPEIVALPGLDLVYLGVFDYSVAIGIPGQVDDPRVRAFVAESARIARDAGKAVGTTAMGTEQVKWLHGVGVNVMLYGADTWLIGDGAKKGLAMLREALR
jgi:4-hydroxy-2-oxoheptanedioate aldolase